MSDGVEETNRCKSLTGHTAKVTSLFADNSCELLFSGSVDETVRIWNIKVRRGIKTDNFSRGVLNGS